MPDLSIGKPGEPIAWQGWDKDLTPGRWSRTHILRTGFVTLCGLLVPRSMADWRGDSDRTCRRCVALKVNTTAEPTTSQRTGE